MKLRNDYLYIGDGNDNTVNTFDSETGRFLGSFVPSGDNTLNGPRGLIFDHGGNLLVSNQRVNEPVNGNVLQYNGQTGQFLRQLVPSNPDAPFAPYGIVLSKKNVLFVADRGDLDPDTGIEVPGELKMYDGFSGAFLGNLDHSGFSPFHPRGLVFGPDGLLYVSAFDFLAPNKGWVLRFDTKINKLLDVFISNDDITELHRPDGLVFGPDGNLYVTSFRADVNDTDKILVVNRHSRKLIDKIDLYAAGQPRAFAEGILFGPEGKLFVPINGPFDPETGEPTGEFTGSVRRYNVHSKKFKEIIPPYKNGGPLGVPTFLTFGKTNPATLAYEGDREESSDHHHHHHHESSDESSS
ncbi:hypothetical protein [Bacillus sp. ISL-7]|uniref:Vgb family protein n=1 Tax=Bacillus sp. ISL-7 TaxID=2819136 RepID=UPI001BECD4C2|nr:hypothetical protein [Bacillus sp. ISL-7]MBT2738746.1 hypothetical protein [Bacillus sp. ISL-7]